MAKASGPALDGLLSGEFDNRNSGVHYRVFQERGRAWLSFDRARAPRVSGKRELLYYIGSNRKGRTYLFQVDGFCFESPINWYAQERRWNMAPGYFDARTIPMTLPALVDCLNCHATGLQAPIAGTENRYSGAPFTQGGIGCERCHGPGAEHAAGRGPIVNPAKLPPDRRDAICMECHLEGSVAIARLGRQIQQFRPGDNLADYMRYFVLTGEAQQSAQSLSQVEAFAMSTCKIKSGDRMSCTSCHDPHFEPAPAEKIAYYRGKCIACHTTAFANRHHPENSNCVGCHMPSLASSQVAHTQATDHRILRRPFAQPPLNAGTSEPRLTPFPSGPSSTPGIRELALAWETLAQRGVEGALEPAKQYLKQAVTADPNDPALLTDMAYVQQQSGHIERARELYERALRNDPLAVDASTDLGVLDARQGQVRTAVELWETAFSLAPYQSSIGTNLATVLCAAGHPEQAQKFILRVLQFNPDFQPANRLRQRLQSRPAECKP